MEIRRLGFGVVALMVLVAVSSPAQTQESGTKSKRLEALEADLKEKRDQGPLRSFWNEVEKTGTPIVEEISGDPTHILATFVWRGSSEAKQVFILPQIESTSAADKMRMSHLLDTNLWYKTYCLPVDSRFTYGFYEASSIVENDSPFKHIDQLQTDRFNAKRFEFPPHDYGNGGTTVVLSLFETAKSPDRHWSFANRMGGGAAVMARTISSKIMGTERRVWVYDSAGNESAGHAMLLVLFDGFDYMHEIPTPTILNNLVRENRIPNLVAVLVDNPPETRTQDLFCSARFEEFIAEELVPWVREQYKLDSPADRSVVGGSSLGGLAAACTALRYPGVFGNVLSQSGSFWWSPGGDREGEWVARQIASSKLLPIRWHLDAGVFEDFPAPNGLSVTNLVANRHLRDVLRAKGYSVDYGEFSGGHEFVNWQSSLATGLINLCQHFEK